MCSTCEFPARRLWTYHKHPAFVEEQSDGWAVMDKCPVCGQLWCEVMYEPHAAFSFWAAWPKKKEEWLALLKKNEGLPCYEWHEAVIVEDYAKLPVEEREAVEAWRRRAYGLTPIDSRKPRFCRVSADLDKFTAL